MTRNLPHILLKGKQLRKFYHIQRKYPVSNEFLKHNYVNIRRFIIYALNPHCVLRRYAWRRRNNRVLIVQRIRHLLFDPRLKRMIKRRKQNIKQWSQRVVSYHKKMGHIEEYEETELYNVGGQPVLGHLGAEELAKQMKEQLELLRSGKRGLSLTEDANKNVKLRNEVQDERKVDTPPTVEGKLEQQDETDETVTEQLQIESTVAATVAAKSTNKDALVQQQESKQISVTSSAKASGGIKFLDMLINKVRVKNFARESNFSTRFSSSEASPAEVGSSTTTTPASTEDSGDDFLGFDESGHQPGMLLTPLVPQNCKTLAGNAAFVSDSLEAYMRKNNIRETPTTPLKLEDKLLEPKALDGLVTPGSNPPHMDMPAVPESLQKLRTVAERRQYLQRFSKNHKMAIINNEANIYRELMRKQRNQKVKAASMLMLQAPTTYMPFTRAGWQAASYVATDHNKYYYQVINVDGVEFKLPGALGNNAAREKRRHRSKLNATEVAELRCDTHCLDAAISRDLKVIKTKEHKVKLNRYPLPAIFRPCPLSQKPYQKPLDDDTAALLLAGGSMAVVSMPTVQLEVEPKLGHPMDEIAKRYLQYILPHHDITREWAEFSVSTLQQPSSMREAEKVAAKTPAGRRKSFTFVIPYLNDRNHILVRRVVDRSEQLDPSFVEECEAKLQNFQFRRELPSTADADYLDCADMISEMINTVAISCSENSFISEDPDGLDVVPGGGAAETTAKDEDSSKADEKPKIKSSRPQLSKQHRLRLELRRLNATIIDAAVKSDDANKKPCSKDYCQLGCMCASLAGELPMPREHCGRADCVLVCRCKRAEQTRVVRVETDGRGISNEDAFNLRLKATARLAKMEKEFTSTLVLTDNETLLINESQCDKKRRCTKAPKRYEDFADTEEEHARISPPKRDTKSVKRVVNIESTNASNCSQSTSYAHVSALTEPCTVRDKDLEQMRHCFVALRRLPDVTNLATFCMTHQLYKCFCGGESLDGKPMVIEKEEQNTTITHNISEVASRARYSFERPPPEDPVAPIKAKQRKEQQPAKISPPPPPPVKQDPLAPPPVVRSAELDIIYSYMKSRPHLCRRIVGVPRNCYQRLNRKHAAAIRQEIARQENAITQELLNSRMVGAIRFYRAELELQRRQEQKRQRTLVKSVVIDVRDDSDENASKSLEPSRKRSSLGHDAQAKRIKLNNDSATEKLLERAENLLESAATSAAAEIDIQVPRISACYSLNSASMCGVALTPSVTHTDADVLGSAMETDMSNASSSSGVAQEVSFRSFYNEVVKNMNALVSKKMQDIDQALQRESKIIPVPNEEILCIIKWTNFLAAFESDFVFIWEVKMKSHSFLAATTSNMMPSVCGALGVVNIFAIDQQQLPLMGRMLLQRKRNENTRRLAVVMQGRKEYWLVKGFLRHMAGNACTKPTPQTHPLLTKKINVLCSLLVKQRMREHQRKVPPDTAAMEADALLAPIPQMPIITPPPAPQATAAVKTSAIVKSAPLVKAAPVAKLALNPSSQCAAALAPATSTTAIQLPKLSRAPANAARASLVLPSKPTNTPTPAPPAACSPPQTRESGFNIRSNIEYRKVNHADVDELQIPELHSNDHRWVVLHLFDDFSHIFVPAFKDMISLDRIHNVMRVASEKRKVVKLQFFQDAPYDAFVTPASRHKIYFGPLRLNMSPPVLVLLQSVDGKMMLREVYQREHSIPVNVERRTMAFWVLHINGQVHFEIELQTPTELKAVKKAPSDEDEDSETSNANDDGDDDDCVIIDGGEKSAETADEQEQKSVPAKSPDAPPIAKPQQRLSFTIQTNNNNGNLQITPMLSAVSQLPQNVAAAAAAATPSKDVINVGGFVPFIANVPITNPLTPHFITPHVQLTQTPAPTVAPENSNLKSAPQPPPAKISRISVHPASKVNESLQQLLSPSSDTAAPVNISVANAGITITKLPKVGTGSTAQPVTDAVTKPTCTLTSNAGGISIATKRTASGMAKQAAVPASGPTIIKQTATTISIGNLPPRISTSRPLMPKTQTRQSLATILPAPRVTSFAQQKRRSEPQKALPTKDDSKSKTSSSGSASNVNKPTANKSPNKPTSTPTTTPVAAGKDVPVYGFLVAKALQLPRFRVKVVDSDFMVRVPSVGVLRLKSCSAASSFLNRQLARNLEYQPHLPAEWKFVVTAAPPGRKSQSQDSPSPAANANTVSNLSSTPAPSKTSTTEASILIED